MGFRGVPKSTLGAPFSAKKSKKTPLPLDFSPQGPTWARLGAEDVPKRPKNLFLSILSGFWTDFGWIVHDFCRFSNDFLHICTHILASIFQHFRVNICSTFSKKHKALNPANHFPKTLARLNARKRLN